MFRHVYKISANSFFLSDAISQASVCLLSVRFTRARAHRGFIGSVFVGTWQHFCGESFTTPEDPENILHRLFSRLDSLQRAIFDCFFFFLNLFLLFLSFLLLLFFSFGWYHSLDRLYVALRACQALAHFSHSFSHVVEPCL